MGCVGTYETDTPLFGDGLGLDSIDALQLVVAMEKDFGVVVPDAATGTRVFASVRLFASSLFFGCPLRRTGSAGSVAAEAAGCFGQFQVVR